MLTSLLEVKQTALVQQMQLPSIVILLKLLNDVMDKISVCVNL